MKINKLTVENIHEKVVLNETTKADLTKTFGNPNKKKYK